LTSFNNIYIIIAIMTEASFKPRTPRVKKINEGSPSIVPGSEFQTAE